MNSSVKILEAAQSHKCDAASLSNGLREGKTLVVMHYDVWVSDTQNPEPGYSAGQAVQLLRTSMTFRGARAGLVISQDNQQLMRGILRPVHSCEQEPR
jgi:hypothetical protein